MSYNIQIDRKALKFINKQEHDQKRRIFAAIYKLPHTGDIKPLANSGNLYRLRVGTYRVIYTVDHGALIVRVVGADNRGDVYKSKNL